MEPTTRPISLRSISLRLSLNILCFLFRSSSSSSLTSTKSPYEKMGVFVPVTRISNHTDDVMALTTVNAFGHVEGKKVISPGGHVDLGHRKGMDRIGADVTFLVRPESRSGVPGKKIFPIQVFDYANIDVVYKSVDGSVLREYDDGAFVDFDFKKDTLFRRIGLVRWFAPVFAAFGNCYHPAMDPVESNINDVPAVAAQGSASTLLTMRYKLAIELVQRKQT